LSQAARILAAKELKEHKVQKLVLCDLRSFVAIIFGCGYAAPGFCSFAGDVWA
jgi:hypothetical protein